MNMQPQSRAVRAFTAALVLLGGLMVSIPSQALTVTLSGVSGNNCTYTSISVDASGNTTVTCTGSTSPGTISLGSSSYTVETLLSVPVTVSRSSGTTGAVTGTVTVTSGACNFSGSSTANVTFADGSSTPSPTSLSLTGGAPGSCGLSLGATAGTATVQGNSVANVTVNAAGLPGTISFSGAPASITVGAASGTISVTRTGGSSGAVSANISGIASVCSVSSPTVSFAAGNTTTQAININGDGAGQCTLTLTSATAVGSPASFPVNASSGGSGNCPATPAGMITASFGSFPGAWVYASQNSGQVSSYALPPFQYPYATLMGSLTRVSPSPNDPVGIEITISPCPGDMLGAGLPAACRFTDTAGSASIPRWAKVSPGWWTTPAEANVWGYCLIDPSLGTWYANLRFTYSSGCGPGAPTCAFSWNWAIGDGRMKAY